MKKFSVIMTIEFSGEVEAESEAAAEALAWNSWGENADALLTYSGVDSIDVEEMEDEDFYEDEEVEED